MFAPAARPRRTQLERRWEERLSREGMPAEVRPLAASGERDGLRIVQASDWGWVESANWAAFGGVVAMSDAAQAQHWARFAAAVHVLPRRGWNKHERKLLHLVAERGSPWLASGKNMAKYERLRRLLRRFGVWRRENGC